MNPELVNSIAPIARLFFYVITLVFAIFTAFLVYHWFTYGTDRRLSNLSLAVYMLGSLPFFIIMALSLQGM